VVRAFGEKPASLDQFKHAAKAPKTGYFCGLDLVCVHFAGLRHGIVASSC
jgi:hypothetical protein